MWEGGWNGVHALSPAEVLSPARFTPVYLCVPHSHGGL